eukprot:1331335-Prymnesium_polylepis.1
MCSSHGSTQHALLQVDRTSSVSGRLCAMQVASRGLRPELVGGVQVSNTDQCWAPPLLLCCVSVSSPDTQMARGKLGKGQSCTKEQGVWARAALR